MPHTSVLTKWIHLGRIHKICVNNTSVLTKLIHLDRIHKICVNNTSVLTKWIHSDDTSGQDSSKNRFKILNTVFRIFTHGSGRGARVFTCEGLVNQLLSCLFDPRIACLENTDTAIVGD